MADQPKYSLDSYFDAVTELDRFIHLAWEGLGYSMHATRVKTTLRKFAPHYKRLPDDEFNHQLEDAQNVEEFAKDQAKQGFRLLYYMAAVQISSILEAAVHDFAINWIASLHPSEYPDSLSRLQGPLIEFIKASPEDQAEYLLVDMERRLAASLKPGAGRFEAVLDGLGLGGPVAPTVRKSLFELHHVRNIIVHRGGKPDRRFIEACPWVDCRPDERIQLGRRGFNRYSLAVDWYLIEMDCRFTLKLAAKKREPVPNEFQNAVEVQADLVRGIDRLNSAENESE